MDKVAGMVRDNAAAPTFVPLTDSEMVAGLPTSFGPPCDTTSTRIVTFHDAIPPRNTVVRNGIPQFIVDTNRAFPENTRKNGRAGRVSALNEHEGRQSVGANRAGGDHMNSRLKSCVVL